MRLFELLQHEPVTRGLFELNRRLPFSFGLPQAEVDLVCVELRLAIEIADAVRARALEGPDQDCRKDVLLRDQGYLVSRPLAADVEERSSEVVRGIRELVLRRRRGLRRASLSL
jgi:very-short-patch-repair endonuclease